MQSAALVSVKEYLNTSYRPDREYVDGVVLERNLGERDHSRAQGRLYAFLYNREKELRIEVFPEQRVQVTSDRFRVPDICVVLGGTQQQVFTTPPFLCIGILSKDDTMTDMLERVDDYLRFGVKYVWLVDPRTRRAYSYTEKGMHAVNDGILRTSDPDIEVPFAAIFEA